MRNVEKKKRKITERVSPVFILTGTNAGRSSYSHEDDCDWCI